MMIFNHRLSVFTVVITWTVASSGLVSLGDDWSGWRGNRQDGICTEADVPLQWSETDNVHWKTAIPGVGHSSPVVTGSRIVLTTAVEETEARQVLCYDRETGKQLWGTQVATAPFEQMHRDNSPASATPLIHRGRIYVPFCASGRLQAFCLSMDGELLWTRDVGAFESRHGFCTSMVAADGKLILSGLQDGAESFIAALNPEDGGVIWQTSRENKVRSFSVPFVVQRGSMTAVILSGAGQTVAYDVADGSVCWTLEGPGSKTVSSIVSDPQAQVLYVAGGRDGRFFAVKADLELPPGEVPELVWEDGKGAPYVTSPLFFGGLLHVVSDEGIHRLRDPETGKTLSVTRIGGSKVSASMIGACGRVYITNFEGRTTVIRNDETCEVLASNEIGENVVASPAVSNGDLILRGEQHLFLIRE